MPAGDDTRPQRRAAAAAMENVEDRMEEDGEHEEEEEDDDSFVVGGYGSDEEEEEEDEDSADEEEEDEEDEEEEDEEDEEYEAKLANAKARKGAKMERSKEALAKEIERAERLAKKEEARMRDKSHLLGDADYDEEEDDDDDAVYETGAEGKLLRGENDELLSPSFVAFKGGVGALIDTIAIEKLDDILEGRIAGIPRGVITRLHANRRVLHIFEGSVSRFIKKALTFIPPETTLYRVIGCLNEMEDYDWYAIPRLLKADGGDAGKLGDPMRRCCITNADLDEGGYLVAMTMKDKDTGKFSLVYIVVSQQSLSFIRAWFTVTRIREIVCANIAPIIQASVAESPYEAPWDHIASVEDDYHSWIGMHYHEYYLARKIVASELGFEDTSMKPRVVKK